MNKSAHIASSISINALRFTLALVFVLSGFVKAVDPMGTVYKMTEYAEAFGLPVPPFMLLLGAWALIVLEYVIGMALLFGFYRRFYLWATILFLCVMTPLTLLLALTNPISHCGCFGDALVLTHWQTFAKNVGLLAMAIIVLANHTRIWRIISNRTQWLVFVYSILSIVLLMQHSLRHLPMWDFRPYAIGTDIIAGMSVPDDAPHDEYETYFLMERDGIQRTFTLDEYPDSTWTFVSRESRLVHQGYMPSITDFHLTDLDGVDVTWSVLEHPGYTFLMVAGDLKRTSEGLLDVINDLHDYAKVNGHPFYMLTASGEETISKWTEHTGAVYPYLKADETLLRTMVRSNPGLIVLNNATIVGKWSAADFPRDAQLRLPTERNTSLTISPRRVFSRQLLVAIWMFFPLLLLVVVDKAWRRKM